MNIKIEIGKTDRSRRYIGITKLKVAQCVTIE